ncbi:MAG: 50S ribosomal protein L11 methyltransferase [Desulfobacterium sp.]|nr:50S ribosomal protein L11 methyltransferase [Desulfobacterium sp.]
MKWIEAKVIFESSAPELAADLISMIFYEFGLKGVSLEEPGMNPEEGWGDNAVAQPAHYSVSGFFPAEELPDSRKNDLMEKLSLLEKQNEILSKVLFREMDEEDWAESWKEYFWPEKITDTIVVKPTWREYKSTGRELIIEIDPGMAFGTGTHPTTALCIQMIEKYLKPGDTFLDIGTGSGILMVAAARLGAKQVWGIDNDSIAVKIAEENLVLNKIRKSDFHLTHGNLIDTIDQPFQVITANILSEVILTLLNHVKQVMKEDGILICSGIIEENAQTVITKMQSIGLDVLECREKEKWVAIVACLPKQHLA